MKPASALAAAWLIPALVCAADLPSAPQSIAASYDMFRNGLPIAVMHETFESKDGAYRIVSESRAVGLLALIERQTLRFVSSGQITAAGLRPLQFEGKRGESDPRQVRGEFDWNAGRLTLVHGGKTDVVDLPRDAQDRLSFLYQFMFHAFDRRNRMELAMTNGRRLGHYIYTASPGVEIDTPLGRMKTFHLVKQHLPDESGAEIWLAPEHRFLPVKLLVLEEDGVRYEQVITRLEIK
jgi:Protein of unknown function (DUF3108)